MQRIALLVGVLALSTAFAGCFAGDAEPAPDPRASAGAPGLGLPAFGIINGVPCHARPEPVELLDWSHPEQPLSSGAASFEMPPRAALVVVQLHRPLLVAGAYALQVDGPGGVAFSEQVTGVRTHGFQTTALADLGDWDQDVRAPGTYTLTWETSGAMVGFGLRVVAQVCA